MSAGLLIALFFASSVLSTGALEAAVGRQALQAATDIRFMTDTIRRSHPGPVNQDDAGFRGILETASKEALSGAAAVRSPQDHEGVLQKYVSAFADKHMCIAWHSRTGQQVEPTPCSATSAYDVAWITIPTFVATKATEQAFKALIEQLPVMRTKKGIIFDLRGNGGGDSSWGTRILTVLFSEEFAGPRIVDLHRDERVEWRVSKDNAIYIASLLHQFQKRENIDSPEVRFLTQLNHDMQCALAADRDLVDEPVVQPGGATCVATDSGICPVQARIVALIDKGCCSATLDFLDELKAICPGAVLIGQETSADTAYMEVRSVPLPSGLGTFTFPIKVYRGRRRQSGEAHIPDIACEGNTHDFTHDSFCLLSCLLVVGSQSIARKASCWSPRSTQ